MSSPSPGTAALIEEVKIFAARACLPFGHSKRDLSSFAAEADNPRKTFIPYVRAKGSINEAFVTDGSGKVVFRHPEGFDAPEVAAERAYEAAERLVDQAALDSSPGAGLRP